MEKIRCTEREREKKREKERKRERKRERFIHNNYYEGDMNLHYSFDKCETLVVGFFI